ncbi:nucleotidyl transferase AbiEii/AbiGii toxin family protein [Thermodesulfobacteriota bacterium]
MFAELLQKIASELDQRKIPYMVIGGQAVLLYGEPRLTRDIDITLGVTTERLDDVIGAAKNSGLKTMVDPNTFTMKTMVLPCQSSATDIRVDFIFSFSPYEQQAMDHVRIVQMGDGEVKFASPEDLIIHKVFAGRPRDLEDVKNVLLKNSDVDIEYIRHWLQELSAAMEEPYLARFEEIWSLCHD